jgi:hypothetical protein
MTTPPKKQKGRSARHASTPTTPLPKSRSNSADAQCARLLAGLENGPLDTITIRATLDVMMPAARVWDLKHRYGKNIVTAMVRRETAPGQMHSVALYSIHPSPQSDLFEALAPLTNPALQ